MSGVAHQLHFAEEQSGVVWVFPFPPRRSEDSMGGVIKRITDYARKESSLPICLAIVDGPRFMMDIAARLDGHVPVTVPPGVFPEIFSNGDKLERLWEETNRRVPRHAELTIFCDWRHCLPICWHMWRKGRKASIKLV